MIANDSKPAANDASRRRALRVLKNEPGIRRAESTGGDIRPIPYLKNSER